MKRITKIIAVMLAIIMISQLLPLSVIAEEVNNSGTSIESEFPTDDVPEGEATILNEIEEEREVDSKSFLLSDKSIKYVQYEYPVHYEENGEMKEIDNSLVLEQPSDADDFEGYTNTDNPTDIKFAKNTGEDTLLKIEHNRYSLSWQLTNEDKNNVNGQIPEPIMTLAAEDREEEKLKAENVYSTIEYDDILPDTDISYNIMGNSIKENIIVNEKSDSYEYEYEISHEGLELVVCEDDSIEAVDVQTRETVFTIPRGYMYDSGNHRSEAIYYELITIVDDVTEEPTGTSILKMTADADWINSSDIVMPVTIDPVILTKQERESILTTSIVSDMPDWSSGNLLVLYAGRESSEYGFCRTLVYCPLPELNKGDVVVSAELNLYQCIRPNMEYFYNPSTPDVQINAYKVTSAWTEGRTTWNTRPSYDVNNVLDYDYVKRTEGWRTWDITKAVQEWYEGTSTNYGIMIRHYTEQRKNADGSYHYNDCGYAEFYADAHKNTVTAAYPVIRITYENHKGLEDRWTYHAYSAGRAGTAYINDHTGNLVVTRDDAGTNGSIMPTTVSHVFNTYQAGSQYGKSGPNVGKGWKLNIQQKVQPSTEYGLTGDSATTFPYVYLDGDGTEHYFYRDKDDNNRLKSEDGLGYILSVLGGSGDKYKITDDKGNMMRFDSNGNLIKISDANGNQMTITYSGTTITKVTDGVGREITLTTDASGNLTKITDAAGRETSYTYGQGGYLTGVTDADGSIIYYYDVLRGGIMINAYETTGHGLTFDYKANDSASRVIRVIERKGMGISATEDISQVEIDYSSYYSTVFTTGGEDDIIGTADDIKTTYFFDNYGRTISTKSEKKDGTSLGGTKYTYTKERVESDPNAFKKVNKVTSEAVVGASVVNLLKNHSAELSGQWTAGTEGTSNYTASMANDKMYMGQKSFKVNVSSTNGSAGYYQDVSTSMLKGGKTYTLSAYVRTAGIEANEEDGLGACINAQLTAGGATANNRSEGVTGTTSEEVNNGWRRVSVTFTVPQAGTTRLRIWLEVKGATGTAWFDAVQLEEGSAANAYNLLENAGFEYDTYDWSWHVAGAYKAGTISTEERYDGGKSLKMTGNGQVTNKGLLIQSIKLTNVTENDTFVLGGWIKTNSIKDGLHKTEGKEATFQIAIQIIYSDGTDYWVPGMRFGNYITDWQYSSKAFSLSDNNSSTNKTPVEIRIEPVFYCNPKEIYFDNIQLVKDDIPSYTYDSDGNLVTVQENSKNKSNMEYTNGDLTKSVSAKGYAYEYTYDDRHNMTQAKSQNEVKTNYTYNSKGIPMQMSVESKDGDLKIGTKATYYQNGNYVNTVTDANGEVSYYDYDLTKGLLKSSTINGQTTYYGYDEGTDRLETVSVPTENGDVFTEYGYTNGMLTEIGHNGFEYNFEYNDFGNALSTAIGNRTLMSYTYSVSDGKVRRSTYGNGDYTENVYDELSRVVGVKNNGTLAFTWKYNSLGQTAEHEDLINNTRYAYEYDTTGRLLRSTMSDRATKERIIDSEYVYDIENNLTRKTDIIKGTELTNIYEYGKDNLLLKTTLPTGADVSNTFDGLNRLTERKLNISNSVSKSTTYTYSAPKTAVNGSNTTTQLKTETIDGVKYEYNYDDAGNITEIYEDDVLKYAYEYDELNQLTLDYDAEQGTETYYTYDNGGNILNKAVVDAETFEVLSETDYEYNDAEWKDLLTSYDGEDITYDEIGNPLSYRDYTMTWERGRKLASLSGNGVTASYKYDCDGIRTQKIVNGVTSKYYYDGMQLILEQRGNDKLFFYYDGDGIPTGLKLNDTAYYYRTNSRNDVTGIYSSDGDLVCEYTYDAWGKLISVTDADGNAITDSSHVANMNPLRYRGYYYDSDTGLYYLQSRYYDAEVGRFISADGLIDNRSVNGQNLFQYCANNPVNNSDPTGELLLAAIVGGVIGAIGGAISAAAKGKSVWAGALTGAIGGALCGAVSAVVGAATFIGTGIKIAINCIAGAAISAGSNCVNQRINYSIEKSNRAKSKVSKNQNTVSKGSVSSYSGSNKQSYSNRNMPVGVSSMAESRKYESFSNYIDVKSVINSAISGVVAAPISMGATSLIDGAFSGLSVGMSDAIAKELCNVVFSGNITGLQTIIDIIT